MGVLLGNGMFNVVFTPGRYIKFEGSFGEPRCIVELYLTYGDGSHAIIASGGDWQAANGPITYSSTYGGEDYDARKVPASWDTAGTVDASAWRAAIVVHGPDGELEPETIPPIAVVRVYRPVAHKQLVSGALVYDLGQNFAGWPQIAVRGEAGAQVKLICGELLDSDGTVSQRSANAGPGKGQWFTYVLNGRGIERWHPRFSYYGFRYVQVEVTGQAHVISLAGDAVHSSAEPAGEFTSSIPLLDRIHTLILRAIENNTESVLTDCPHREKLGWLEESHLMGSAMNFDFGLERLYDKVEADMADEQKPDGSVPTIAPEYVVFPKPANDVFNDSPEWGSAAVLDPWIAYRRYGNVEALRTAYPTMRHYVEVSDEPQRGRHCGLWPRRLVRYRAESSRLCTAHFARADGNRRVLPGHRGARRRGACTRRYNGGEAAGRSARFGCAGVQRRFTCRKSMSMTAAAKLPMPCRWCWASCRHRTARPCSSN